MLIHILTGDDAYSKNLWIKSLVGKQASTIIQLHADDKKAMEECNTLFLTSSLFSSHYVVILTGLDSAKEQTRWLPSLKGLRDIVDHELVIDYYGALPLSKTIQSLEPSIHAFELPKPWKLDQWESKIIRIAESSGLQLNRSQIHLLMNRTGLDLWRVDQEIKKLRLIKDDTGHVDPVLFDLLVYDSSSEGAAEFAFLMMNGELDKMIAHIREGILSRLSENQILYQLIRITLILYQLGMQVEPKARYAYDEVAALSKQMKLPIPFLARLLGFRFRDEHNQNLLYQYTQNALIKLLEMLWDTDYRWKQENAYPEMTLLVLYDSFQRRKK